MKFDGPLGLAELGPGKQGQAQIDGGAVEAVDRVLESEFVLWGDALATFQQVVEELFHDPMVALGVGVGQGGSPHGRQPQVIELGFLGAQRDLDVAQAVLVGGLGVEEDRHLAPCAEFFDVTVAGELLHSSIKLMSRHEAEQLMQNRVRMHGQNPPSD